MSNKPLLIVFEPCFSGHHETLLRQYLRMFCRMDLEVRLLCSKSEIFRGEQWMENVLADGRLTTSTVMNGWGQNRRLVMPVRLVLASLSDFLHWLRLRREVKEMRRRNPDSPILFYFMFLGSKPFFPCIFWNWCLPVPWAALFSPAWRAPRSWRYTWAGRCWERLGTAGLRSAWCRHIFCWRGEPHDFLHANVSVEKIELITDSTDISLPAAVPGWLTTLEGNCRDRKVVCLVGAIHPRKGVRAFLKVAEILKEEAVCFVIAGEVLWGAFDSGTTRILRDAVECGQAGHGNLFVLDQRIPEEADFNWLVKWSTVCYLAYVGFDGSSNVLSKASAFGVPVIVSEGTILANACRQYNLGWVVDEDNEATIAEAVREAMAAPPDRNALRDFAGYAARQSENALEIQLTSMVRVLQQGAPSVIR